jgi:hypothetical protein
MEILMGYDVLGALIENIGLVCHAMIRKIYGGEPSCVPPSEHRTEMTANDSI